MKDTEHRRYPGKGPNKTLWSKQAQRKGKKEGEATRGEEERR